MSRILILILILSSSKAISQIDCQKESMWCWAACIQSVMAQSNIYQSQDQIVSSLAGWPENRPAHINEVINVLRQYRFRSWSIDYPGTPVELKQTLNSGWKIIAFVNPTDNPQVGHFILLQGLTWDGYVVISDPTTCRTYKQTLNDLYFGWKWSRSIVVGTP